MCVCVCVSPTLAHMQQKHTGETGVTERLENLRQKTGATSTPPATPAIAATAAERLENLRQNTNSFSGSRTPPLGASQAHSAIAPRSERTKEGKGEVGERRGGAKNRSMGYTASLVFSLSFSCFPLSQSLALYLSLPHSLAPRCLAPRSLAPALSRFHTLNFLSLSRVRDHEHGHTRVRFLSLTL